MAIFHDVFFAAPSLIADLPPQHPSVRMYELPNDVERRPLRGVSALPPIANGKKPLQTPTLYFNRVLPSRAPPNEPARGLSDPSTTKNTKRPSSAVFQRLLAASY